ncbi:Rossmann-like and DUF2520 domain-containing protein [Nonlabens antarcticus]|uniref:Rossmann-like and DUF2520 domain-containing protein n=1 Tax=Nonlabens antarcticus TaxID=392714 RepID=UPI001891E0B5|nr:Rossmann-like and DUF2520 domain-containing protein [Nonlabens antarcticus]
MIKVFIIGTGNLGTQLCYALEKSMNNSVKLVGYRNNKGQKLESSSAPLFQNSIPDCDLIILAVPDDLIAQVSNSLNISEVTVVHTSGSVDMKELSSFKNHGVLYIPQTFSKERAVDFANLFICLEASTDTTMKQLELVASSLSRKQKHINSTQRRELHLAAVYMNNFVNHCYYKADQLLEKASIPTALLQPLMEETLKKAQDLGALKAQTGPAKRGDQQTINRHLELLEEDDRDMYRVITNSIEQTHGKKL